MLTTIEHHTGPSPQASIIWLHGLGADGHDFLPIARELMLPMAVRFVFPNAPSIPVSINGGYIMPAWYDIRSPDLTLEQDAAGIHHSQKMINELTAQEMQRGIAANNIVLAGFSQGGAIALQTALRYEQALAGVIALSTYLPLQASLQSERNSANADIPIFMAHGTQDTIVPVATALASATHLQEHGYHVSWHQYTMPHSVCDEEIAAIQEFLLKVLPS